MSHKVVNGLIGVGDGVGRVGGDEHKNEDLVKI